jgi:hypothetical protein
MAEKWCSMSAKERAMFVATHPAAAAQFFDIMISNFLDIILGYGKPGPGLFGSCEAYYGMVEAQGRGTLHCHLLIWLEGNPSPQNLRDKLVADVVYREEHGFLKPVRVTGKGTGGYGYGY